MILCAAPHAQYRAYAAEIDAAIRRVLDSGWYVLGNEVKAFEKEFAEYCGVEHVVGVANGTDAIALALKACDIGPGDEVITTAHTAVATVAAVEMAGAVPVMVDIDPVTFTLDAQRAAEAITGRTKAILPVHLYGQPADLSALCELARSRELRLIEDCAQAHGAMYRGKRVGSFGDAAAFSFYPTKNLGAIGDGGAVVTRDAGLAERLRLLREYGWAQRYVSKIAGVNTRLDELQAAVLRVKLRHLDDDNRARGRLADFYHGRLAGAGVTVPSCRVSCTHVYHLYVIRSDRRDELQAHLKARDIGALIHYPVPIHQQPAYAGRLAGPRVLQHTERAAAEVLSLPVYPELAQADAEKVAAAILEFSQTRAAQGVLAHA